MPQPVDPAAPSGSLPEAGRPPRQHAPALSLTAWRHFYALARPFWAGRGTRLAWTLLGALLVLMLAETYLAVLLNDRSGEMLSALAARDESRFWVAVQACLLVLAFAVPVYAFYYFMRDTFANHWRRWLTARFLDGYLGDRRYYEMTGRADIDNPDQRISEDINTFTGRSIHFLLIFLGAVIQLVAFSAVLWSISRTLVAFLAVYSVVGTYLALQVFGAPLIRLNFWQLKREADFRFGLMRLRENAESVAFYRGEAQERAHLDEQFESVYDNYRRLIRRQRALNMFQRGFLQLTIVVPSVILAADVLGGRLEVGRAAQAAGAFAAVLLAVAVIVDNFESLSRFVAGIDRLYVLSRVVLGPRPDAPMPEAEADSGFETVPPARPQITTRLGDTLAVEALTLYTPQAERLLVRDLHLALAPGQGLLIVGPSGCGKSSLLRAIAGLWHTGTGVVQHPPLEDMLFLPQQPYMQIGTLRSQIIYPATTTDLSDDGLLQILADVQLPDLAGHVGGLDAVRDWEKLLSVGEQQRLAFARVLVRRPRIAILDEATSALDTTNETRLYERLRADGATLVSVAHRASVLRHHTHVLEFTGDGAWALHAAADYRADS